MVNVEITAAGIIVKELRRNGSSHATNCIDVIYHSLEKEEAKHYS